MKGVRALRRGIDNIDTAAQSLREVVAGIANQSDLLNRKFQEVLASSAAQYELINRKFDALLAANVARSAKAGRLTAGFDEQRAEIGALQRETGRLVVCFDEQRTEIGPLPQEIGRLAAGFDEQQAEIGALRRQLTEQQGQVQTLLQELAEERARRQRLETHDEIRAADLRNAGERIVHLQEQITALNQYCARLTPAPPPPDLAGLRKHVGKLAETGEPIPDDVQERSLRLELRADPFNIDLTYSLVALLRRLARAPLPEPPIPEADAAAETEGSGIDTLLREAAFQADAGHAARAETQLWQAVVRYPRSARGWAEYARHFAERREWAYCRAAVEQVLAHGVRRDRAAMLAALNALAALAQNGELGTLIWADWLARLPAGLRSHPAAAALLSWTGDRAGAAALLPAIVNRRQAGAERWIVAATIAFENERWDDAYQYWRRAFEADLPRALRAGVTDHSARLSQILQVTGRDDELADWLSGQSERYERVNLIPPLPTRASERAAQALRDRAIARGLPSVLLVTQSKSASVSIGSLFNHGFGLVSVLYSLIDRRVVAPWLADYLRGGACFVTHLVPSERNIALLAEGGVDHLIVNVRDPRQWVISQSGHIERYATMLPPSRRSPGGLQESIDPVIGTDYPQLIRWIDGWVAAQARLNITFTTFEEFVRDRDAFVDRMLTLYGGDRRHFDREAALVEQRGVDYHRRNGTTDEWRAVLTRAQTEAINRLIPDRLWRRFGWEP